MILIILHAVRLFKCGQSGWLCSGMLHGYHPLWVLPRVSALFSYPWASPPWTLQGPVLSQSCARLGTDSDHGSPLQVETVDGVIKNRIESYERAINRDEAALERQEKQVKSEIKKMAKIDNKEAFSFSQRACTTMETANRNFCPKYKSHFYIHTNKSDKFPDEDGCAMSAIAKTT